MWSSLSFTIIVYVSNQHCGNIETEAKWRADDNSQRWRNEGTPVIFSDYLCLYHFCNTGREPVIVRLSFSNLCSWTRISQVIEPSTVQFVSEVHQAFPWWLFKRTSNFPSSRCDSFCGLKNNNNNTLYWWRLLESVIKAFKNRGTL